MGRGGSGQVPSSAGQASSGTSYSASSWASTTGPSSSRASRRSARDPGDPAPPPLNELYQARAVKVPIEITRLGDHGGGTGYRPGTSRSVRTPSGRPAAYGRADVLGEEGLVSPTRDAVAVQDSRPRVTSRGPGVRSRLPRCSPAVAPLYPLSPRLPRRLLPSTRHSFPSCISVFAPSSRQELSGELYPRIEQPYPGPTGPTWALGRPRWSASR